MAARVLVDEMTVNVRAAMTDASALAETIYPPLLAARGFPSAIRSAAERLGIAVLVDAPAAAGYPPEITTAVYRTCVEAMSFASAGSEAIVSVLDSDGVLTFAIAIDGQPSAGSLARLRDRLEALDGGIDIDDRDERGSRLHGWLPSAG